MKISIALSLFILALGATLGWQDHQRLTSVRTIHDQLVAEAAKAGITLDPGGAKDGVRVTKRDRGNKEAEARSASAEFIAFAREMDTMENKGRQDEATQKRIIDLMDKLMSLDVDQLKILIAEVRAAKDLKDDTRKGLIGFSIMSLASDHPRAALTLFTESSDLIDTNGMGRQVVSSSLSKWAQDDPSGAMAWIKANGAKFPDLVSEDAKRGLISGAAKNDPKLAFSLIGELGLKQSGQAVSSITGAAKTPEERTATLAALRDYQKTLEGNDARNNAFSSGIASLAQGAARDGFTAGSKWLENANLSGDELVQATQSLSYQIEGGDTGKWIGWMGAKLPEGKADNTIRDMVRRWTESDYKAAGEWLAASPAGNTKNSSVRAYAETIARYEPAAAADWAMTLPEGKERDKTLRNIYQNWPKGDDAAKEAFKQAHGFE